ncbi:MogA/MoaB family molybdenum cofactor biosynthesis protein [Methanohalophilus halophilus]|uniref:Molybdenum cofactor biosynthesis protein n=1 Tax=Methanohalophilus halophilus TaxID=2177 RepID=A0A1L3Q4Z9_9EURY|nr:molybdenum cofactor biosynthesis protein B [Methanohalophilus halophilus]APH39893.1 molybdenum cofactor biosynthesis protein [Methanohalophilus halophilus]RNI07524.1 molybdenum cofactor biosynthesis protein MoaB [Methanohalophilus halophilus]SDW66780.1 molybdopterin adenylyltransferase [Methanohalophilus halophilus]
MSSSTKEHKKGTDKAHAFSLVTISTSRFDTYGSTESPSAVDDVSGQLMSDLIEAAHNKVLCYSLVADNIADIRKEVLSAIFNGADVVITTGGTGLSACDVTIEALCPLFEKELEGFGELFRLKSLDQIGSATILSRATAGIIQGCAVFCLPGSPKAVELAIEEIVLPEAGHIVKHARS